MVWHNKYWDALDNLYWTPKHLGLKSIPKSKWGDDPATIQFPRQWVKNGGTIYTRAGTYASNAERMKALEETLNHIFDITFGIVADTIVAKLLHEPAGICDDRGPFERLGREVSERFGWDGANVTQHDGFFVSPKSVLAVELKLGSKTSPSQLAKYIAMIRMEERRTGTRLAVALLYVTPQDASDVLKQAGADQDGELPVDFVDQLNPEKLNPTLKQIYREDIDGVRGVASRLRLAHLTWSELLMRCEAIIQTLSSRRAGDQTLGRLLDGFVVAVREHCGTGCGEAP